MYHEKNAPGFAEKLSARRDEVMRERQAKKELREQLRQERKKEQEQQAKATVPEQDEEFPQQPYINYSMTRPDDDERMRRWRAELGPDKPRLNEEEYQHVQSIDP